ncbi:MAG TPA: hypothetical protein PKJ53_04110 [Spirochaetales bacterium]|nr:hypothetical protein [Spirochaetales bacterium]
MENIVLSWSGGKDSAMTLFALSKSARYKVVSLQYRLTRKLYQRRI